MFIRGALLVLLAACLAAIESKKLHDILKKTGKRYLEEPGLYDAVDPMPWYSLCTYDLEECSWIQMSEEDCTKAKKRDAKEVLQALADASCSEIDGYEKNYELLESIMDQDMTAEICGEGKKMNGYQYMKYLKTTASQYKISPYRNLNWEIADTDRNTIQMRMNLTQTDKMGLPVMVVLDVTMKIQFEVTKKEKSTLFRITHISQGGSCAERGTVSYLPMDPIDKLIDDIEELKTHPTARLFLKLFTPPIFQYSDQNPHKLPRYWLGGISQETKINVCHEGVTDPMTYTEDQFRTYYRHFGYLWHPKKGDEDSMEIQVLSIGDDSIIARVTMKLQMGHDENAKVHDWNFKFSAKKKEVTGWYIDQLEVLCTPTVDLKSESLPALRDTVGAAFLSDLYFKPDPTQKSLAFVERFTKNGLPEFSYWGKKFRKSFMIRIYFNERDRRNITMFSKYYMDPDQVTNGTNFTFSTISSTVTGDVEYENEWKFDVKWDDMDQVYHVEKLEIGEHKKLEVVGEYGDKKYIDIKYRKEEPEEK